MSFFTFIVNCYSYCYEMIMRCKLIYMIQLHRAFPHDFTAAILVFQNKERAVMLMCRYNPVGVEFFSYAKAFFCSKKFA